MPTLRLSAPLFELLPEQERRRRRGSSVALQASSWDDAAAEVRLRFPVLANRVLTPDGAIAGGFLLALNDEIVPRGQCLLELKNADELCVIAQLAGG